MSLIIIHPAFSGSTFFLNLAKYTGVPLDKTNFMICYTLSFLLAGFLRKSLSFEKVGPATRHIFCIFFGICFGYFCFGKQANLLIGFSTLMYAVIYTQDPKFLHIYVFFIGMFYLLCVHIYLQFIINYATNALDIAGPLMIMTGKVSCLAYSLHDELSREEDLMPSQKKRLIRNTPNILEFFSYMLNFLTILAGPFMFYDEYVDFIYERPIQNAKQKMSDKELNSTITFVALKKAICGYLSVIIALPFLDSFNARTLIGDEFWEKNSYLYQLWYMNVLVNVTRCGYYFAWIFGEAICNNAGFGLNGFDQNGQLRMDLLTNVTIWKLEFASNVSEYSRYWNTVTIRWLRFVVYDRVPYFRRYATYLTSTIWHGFHPKNYTAAIHGILYLYASFSFRRYVRPNCLGSTVVKLFYDVLSILATRIAIMFLGIFAVLYENEVPIKLNSGLYFMHLVLTILAIICPPFLFPVKKEPGTSNVKENKNESDKNKVE